MTSPAEAVPIRLASFDADNPAAEDIARHYARLYTEAGNPARAIPGHNAWHVTPDHTEPEEGRPMTIAIDFTPDVPDYTAGLPLVAIIDGETGPYLPVAVHRFEHDLYVAVVDRSRGLTDRQVYDEIDENFAGQWTVADVVALFQA